MADLADPPATPNPRPTWRERLERWGRAGLAVYLILFFGAFVGFSVAIQLGFAPEGALGAAGTVGSAYLATKATQPVRIGITAVVAPVISAWWERRRS